MEDWPIYYKDLLKIGNLNSNVGIATLWTIFDEITEKIDKNNFSIAGQLYSKNGINYLVRNLLSNKNIRYLIISGQDRSDSGKEILNLWKTKKSKYIHSEIDEKSLKKMIDNVKIIDLIGVEDSKIIEKEIKKLNQSVSSYGEKEIFPEHKEKEVNELECFLPTDNSIFKVKGETIADTWIKVLDNILKFGQIKSTDSNKIKEVLNMAAVITDENPDEFYIPKFLGFDKKKIEEYSPQITSKDKIPGLHYTYGHRLMTHFGIDQIETIIEKIKKDNNAREAVSVLFDPKIDHKAEHRPCLVLIQVLYNQNKLNLNAYVRSHDMFGGWALNTFGLRKLQKIICDETKLQIGSLTIISASAHIYEYNFVEAKNIVEENKKIEFESDPRGFFKIDIDKKEKEIIVEHFSPEGLKLKTYRKKVVDSKQTSSELASDIYNNLAVSLISHAFDLGMELQKAETAIRLNLDYKQDKTIF